MKFLNDFKNIFAVLGIVSIIFWTCASDSTSDDNSSNLPPQITEGYGKYQVSGDGGRLVILNTETGDLKTYYNNVGEWTEGLYYNSENTGPLFGSGNLTVTH